MSINQNELQELEAEIRRALFPTAKLPSFAPPPKTQIEVTLLVERTDGVTIPFYFNDEEGVSFLGAQVSASMKAREFNLRVIEVSDIALRERPRGI